MHSNTPNLFDARLDGIFSSVAFSNSLRTFTEGSYDCADRERFYILLPALGDPPKLSHIGQNF